MERAAILQLLACEDQTLLVWRNALLVLDLGLHGVNGVASLDLECDGLAGQCLHEDLHVGDVGLILSQPRSAFTVKLQDSALQE